ncbi:hypothetical protein GZ77_20390 [Endozoicomonas montiporae]|uniref:DUF2878 domain-containing protein n=2 Tax=Endozoicomonas montiporae TaxID=1027273 RepID=A0A081N2Z2_9GAMM|nr:DUF2878 domain-containing protein [Endozoicomonas montiporae]AMO58085.1 hypothetical protein EZMO1_4160 [Endozoicomonas montiporae CL-33]KEQ12815.1 hypothetical protein GZ77_20390 [Endozoicomonas montiporae]
MELHNVMSSNFKWVAVGLSFNLFWFVTVVGQSHFIWLPCIMLLISWWLAPRGLLFALSLAIPGIIMDAMLTHVGVYAFEAALFPFWLVVLWLGFSTFIWNIRELIVCRRPYVMIALGGVGGMASYLAGERLGAVLLPLGLVTSAMIISICWTLFSVLGLRWLKAFDQQTQGR